MFYYNVMLKEENFKTEKVLKPEPQKRKKDLTKGQSFFFSFYSDKKWKDTHIQKEISLTFIHIHFKMKVVLV